MTYLVLVVVALDVVVGVVDVDDFLVLVVLVEVGVDLVEDLVVDELVFDLLVVVLAVVELGLDLVEVVDELVLDFLVEVVELDFDEVLVELSNVSDCTGTIPMA